MELFEHSISQWLRNNNSKTNSRQHWSTDRYSVTWWYSQILIMFSLHNVPVPLMSSLWLGTFLFPIWRVQTFTDKVFALPGQILIKSSLSGRIPRVNLLFLTWLYIVWKHTYAKISLTGLLVLSIKVGRINFKQDINNCLGIIPKLLDQR